MDAAASPTPEPVVVPPAQPPEHRQPGPAGMGHGSVADVLTAWTRPAQLATAFLLGLATALVAVSWYASSPWASRPSQLEHGPAGAYRVDLNRADHAELLQLPGVGEGLARRIVAYRREHGPFRSVNDLRNVRNVGPATLSRLRPWVCVQEDEAGEVEPPAAFRRSARPAGAATPVAFGATRGRRVSGKKAAGITRPIDLNRASAADLQRLPGIGPVIAGRVVEARRKAPFQSVDDLRGRVPGIGPKKLEVLRPYATVAGDGERVASAEQDEDAGTR